MLIMGCFRFGLLYKRLLFQLNAGYNFDYQIEKGDSLKKTKGSSKTKLLLIGAHDLTNNTGGMV